MDNFDLLILMKWHFYCQAVPIKPLIIVTTVLVAAVIFTLFPPQSCSQRLSRHNRYLHSERHWHTQSTHHSSASGGKCLTVAFNFTLYTFIDIRILATVHIITSAYVLFLIWYRFVSLTAVFLYACVLLVTRIKENTAAGPEYRFKALSICWFFHTNFWVFGTKTVSYVTNVYIRILNMTNQRQHYMYNVGLYIYCTN